MDANRFDELSRALAEHSNRRDAVRKGGLMAAVVGALGLGGGARALAVAQSDDQQVRRCQVAFRSKVAAGPNKGATFEGLLTLQIGAAGAIDGGSLETEGPKPYKVVGQATGRALDLRVTISADRALALSGVGERNVHDCRGKLSGTFAGPEFGDVGTWEAERRSGAASPTANPDDATGDIVDNPAPTIASGSDAGGDGSSPTATSTPCAEEPCDNPAQTWNPETCRCECYGGGELCGDICCPVGGVCDEAGGSCTCPTGTVLCGTGCVDECPPGSTLDPTSCACVEGCPSGQVLCNGACVGPCTSSQTLNTTTCVCDELCPSGQAFCSGTCVDIVNDRNNCGSCGNVCLPGVPCIAGTCECPATTKYCANVQMCKDENATC